MLIYHTLYEVIVVIGHQRKVETLHIIVASINHPMGTIIIRNPIPL